MQNPLEHWRDVGGRPAEAIDRIVRRRRQGHVEERTWLVPGLRRYASLSHRLLRPLTERLAAGMGPCDVFVCTSPYLAPHLPAFRAAGARVYYAHDAFEYFDWDREVTRRLQDQLLNECDLTLTVARQLQEDFVPRTPRPVWHSPQAFSSSFLAQVQAAPEVPADLADLPRPLVGSVGVLNRTYDWDWIDQLVAATPDATFVFVGPMMTADGTDPGRLYRSLSAPNVRWLGGRPHEALPRYLAGFDVLLSPLRVDDHNDRRCPLRFYDYMVTDRPILSTGIREAEEFRAHMGVATEPEDAVRILQGMLGGEWPVDREARAAWRASNSFETRAQQVIAAVESLAGTGRPLRDDLLGG
ncbi:MAG: glycosyltransferase [Dehalococcoidia bacterium]|nr:glycosyltransferase [Dehalococcoidia bacterium]